MAKILNVPGWYSSQEIMDRFHWDRSDLNRIAKYENFERKEVGRAYLFNAKQVEAYAIDLTRTKLARIIGFWSHKGLLRDTAYDMVCPKCKGFAVREPTSDRYLCAKGHSDSPILEEIGRDKLIDTEAIKRNSNLLALVESDVKLIKISTTGDGEYEAPCPFCGGKDRFHIQPFFEGGARWFCRNCTNSKWQDVINYVMRREKCDFITACRKLTNGDLPQTNQMIRHEHTSTPYAPPQVDWQSEARKYIARCQEDLWTNPKAKKALEYLRKDRGLKDDTILHFKLGYSSGIQGEGDFYVAKGITIPCSIKDDIWYIKIRLVPGEVTKCGYCKEFIPGPGICPKCGKENKYKGVKGNRPAALYNADDLVEGDLALLTEGEFDCQIAWQELNKYVPCVTMGSATNIPDLTTWGEYLRRPCVLLAAYDNDNPGSTRAHEMAKMLGEVVKLVALPAGIKDINALYLSGADLYNWIKGYLIFYKLPGGFSGTKIIK